MASTIDISRQKLFLPLNEAKGSSIAYDYSLNRYDATINGTAYLDSAHEGNGVYFPDGAGTVDVEVVAGTARHVVGTGAADQRVVAVQAVQDVAAAQTHEHVVATVAD